MKKFAVLLLALWMMLLHVANMETSDLLKPNSDEQNTIIEKA